LEKEGEKVDEAVDDTNREQKTEEGVIWNKKKLFEMVEEEQLLKMREENAIVRSDPLKPRLFKSNCANGLSVPFEMGEKSVDDPNEGVCSEACEGSRKVRRRRGWKVGVAREGESPVGTYMENI
jgi:hypothetical protein